MANLVAIAYDDLDQAKQVMSTVGELVREHSLEVDDAVIVEKRQDGKIKLHQPSMGGAGAQRRALGWADRAHHSDAALRHGHRAASGAVAGRASDSAAVDPTTSGAIGLGRSLG